MSLFENIFATKQTPAPTPNAAAPNSAAGNNTVPNANTMPPNPNNAGGEGGGAINDGKPKSPLANFEKLWETDPNAVADTPFAFNADPAKLLEAAKGVDFTQVLTPELNKRIQAGGADGQQAMMEAMNSVAQMTFAQSANASTKLIEQALQKQDEQFQKMLPGLIKQHSVSDSLRSTNPLLTNPAMAPMIEALQMQFTRKFPQATSQEIKSYVNDYLNGAADEIVAQRPQPKVTKPGRVEQDWEKYFSTPSEQ